LDLRQPFAPRKYKSQVQIANRKAQINLRFSFAFAKAQFALSQTQFATGVHKLRSHPPVMVLRQLLRPEDEGLDLLLRPRLTPSRVGFSILIPGGGQNQQNIPDSGIENGNCSKRGSVPATFFSTLRGSRPLRTLSSFLTSAIRK